MHARRRRLAGGDAGCRLDRLGVPGAGLGERDRKGRAIAMDYVVAEDQRDLEPRLPDREALHPAGRVGAGEVQQPPH